MKDWLFNAVLFLFTIVGAQGAYIFVGDTFQLQVTRFTWVSCASSLSARSGVPMISINNVPRTSQFFISTTTLHIAFLYTGNLTVVVNDNFHGTVTDHSYVVLPRTIALGSVLSTVKDADYELATYVMIDHVNNYLKLLPNTTLTFSPKRVDGCSPSDAVNKVLEHLSDTNVPQVIFGPSCSVQCPSASTVAATSNIPVISYLEQADFSNEDVYPFFMRTQVLTQSRVSSIILDFIRRMGYTKVALLQMDTLQFSPSFYSTANSFGIDIAVKATISTAQRSFVDEINSIKNSGVRVIACSLQDSTADYPEQQLVFREAIQQGIMGPDSGYTWITYNLPSFSLIGLWPNLTSFVNGTLAPSAPETYALPAARQDMINRWNNITTNYVAQNSYWYNNSKPNTEEILFSYSYGMCSPVNAVLTVAYALQQLIYVQNVEYTGQTLIETMKNVDFVGPCGRVNYNSAGDLLYNLGMANYIYSKTNPPVVTRNQFDNNYGAPTIPMSINLANVLLNGKRDVGQWNSDFTCMGGCGNGACIGPNDCQCHPGFTKVGESTATQAAACTQESAVIDDSIVVQLIPASNFLITRAYEEVIAQAVARSLMVNVSQIRTVDYSMAQDGSVSYEFALYADVGLTKVVLESALTDSMNTMANNLDPLLASSLLQTNMATKDWLRFSDQLGSAFGTILAISALTFIVTFAAAVKLFQLPFKTSKEHENRSRSMGFNWYTNGTTLFGVVLSITTAFIQMTQPGDGTCRAYLWTLFLSLALILNVKVAKLYRLHRIFNNPELKQIKLPDSRLMLQYVIPSILVTVAVLIAGEVSGSAVAVLETSSSLGRPRGFVCTYPSTMISNAVRGSLLAIHITTCFIALILRFYLRHVQAFHLDPIYSDVILVFVSPFIMGPLWFNAASMSPRSLSIVVVTWMILVTIASLIIQHSYMFMRVLVFGEKVVTSSFRSSSASRATSSAPASMLTTNADFKLLPSLTPSPDQKVYDWHDANLFQLRIDVAPIGRFFRGLWRKYDVKYYSTNTQQNILTRFLALLQKDGSCITLSATNVIDVVEMDPTKNILRVKAFCFVARILQITQLYMAYWTKFPTTISSLKKFNMKRKMLCNNKRMLWQSPLPCSHFSSKK